MSTRALRRTLLIAAVTAAVSGCGQSSPSAPTPTVDIALGPQVLRITALASGCVTVGDPASIIPFIYTRVTLTRSGAEWVATSSTPEAGTLELRFRETSQATLTGFMNVGGTLKGTGINVPDAAGITAPPWDTRVDFGGTGVVLTGVAFGVTPLTPVAGLSGTGSGSITLSNGAGKSCSGTAFTWGMGSQP